MNRPLALLNNQKNLGPLKVIRLWILYPKRSIIYTVSFLNLGTLSPITLLDENWQWFKSSLGIDFTETPETFLQHIIMGEGVQG
jgi:hypothetical protein